ncbi:hypothetical protein VNO78_07209 [Psophocarpus tetragonolobus]|uniref:Uncharacterized protein n=1 Tax=Psophocarpus tetragonolobus TaxID=3891 RepID=A0AAN9SUB3_PSOTE
MFLFDTQLLNFEENADVVFSDNKWNRVEISYANHITNHEIPIKQVAKYSGIHVFKQTSGMDDVKFSNPPQAMIKIMTDRLQKDQAMLLDPPILTTGLSPLSTPLVERPWEKFQGETSGYLQVDEAPPTTVHNDPVNIERCEGDDINLEAAVAIDELETEDSSSNITDSDTDDPFNHVDKKWSVRREETISSVACSGDIDISLTSIREAIGALELLMDKDLSEVSSDPAMQSQINHFLDLLATSSHGKVTIELKEALVEFKKNAFATFQDFQATAQSVNKLNNFVKQRARIQKETSAGKNQRRDLKKSIKKASLAIKVENSRKKELEAEIASLKKQLTTKEMDLEELVLNLKNVEADISTYKKNCNSLDEHARALGNEAGDLLAANSGVEDEGKAAELKQNLLNQTWSTDVRNQLGKIKNNILGLSK